MAVLQHYYTSYVNRETGSAGFQVKAMSPGISSDTQSTITRLISYRIPSRLDEYETSTHPVALRYYYRSPEEAILLCSQSNGTDENGRPGNFFAHSLITEPDIFANMPAILYWRSPLWRTKDQATRSVIEPLHSLEEIETSLDVEGVWHFLAQGKRIEQFHQLMAAVVHCNSTQRRIVIIDDADHVALWIAAISFMLPPDYRPLLSFATYHHDPYQSQFMVTGTTSDSSFRASPDEYMSYFILNTETGKISDVDASAYAYEAAQAAQSYEIYESKLLSFITETIPFFPRPERIDEQLDYMALYAGLLAPNHAVSLTTKELKAIHVVLTTFEQMRYFTQEDLDDLRQIGGLLQETSLSQKDADVDLEYGRVVALLKKHKVPTDQSALREITYITQHLVNDIDLTPTLRRLEYMQQTYGEDLVIDTVNSPKYLQWLNQLTETITVAQLTQLWKHIGGFLTPGPHSKTFVITSLTCLNMYRNSRQASSKEVNKAFEALILAMVDHEKDWLRLIVGNSSLLPERTFEHFYCWMVGRYPLAARLPYREIAQIAYPDIIRNELRYEIARADQSKRLPVLEEWADYARSLQLTFLPTLLQEGITRIMKDTPENQRSKLATKILVNPALAPLPPDVEERLVSDAISEVSLSHYTPLDIELCKKYRTRIPSSTDTRVIMDGLLVMSSGDLNEELAHRLQQRMTNLRPEVYEADTKSFVSQFLQVCTTARSHQLMINSFFDWHHSEAFWQPYWQSIQRLLTYPGSSTAGHVVKLLSFWFAARPDELDGMYLLHYFFMELPQKLDEAQETRSYQEAARYINALIETERWYPLLQSYFSGRRNALVSAGQSLAAQFQKLKVEDSEKARLQAEKEQKERKALEDRISTLFDRKRPRQQHAQYMREIYKGQQRELFWSIYWNFFKSSFTTTNNAQYALELLRFWFDDSFNVLPPGDFLPQQFFLGLRRALLEAQKERGFRELASDVYRLGTQQKQMYPWFALLQTYFEEQEKRFGLFKR